MVCSTALIEKGIKVLAGNDQVTMLREQLHEILMD